MYADYRIYMGKIIVCNEDKEHKLWCETYLIVMWIANKYENSRRLNVDRNIDGKIAGENDKY